MGKTESILIWEHSLYCNVPGKGWTHFHLNQVEDAVGLLQEHFKVGTRFAVIYDPDGFQTEYAECPPGGRVVVREAMSGSHESIASMHTAWGYQTPVPVPGSPGSSSTLCSYETAPVFVLLRQGLEEVKRPVVKAFPLVSLGTQAGSTPGRTSIFMVVDHRRQAFLYLSTVTGVRTSRKLFVGKHEEGYDIWSEISMVFGEYGITFEDGGQRPMIRVYEAPGTDIKGQCPYWDTLERMAQVEIYNISVLPGLLNNLPSGHCSSLMVDMPRKVELDLAFQILSGGLALFLLGFGAYAFLDISDQNRTLADLRNTEAGLNAQRAILNRNKAEMEKLNGLYARGVFEASQGRFKLVGALADTIPAEATLESATAGMEDPYGFRIKGLFWNAGMDESAAARRVSGTSTPATRISIGLTSRVTGLLVDNDRTTFSEDSGMFSLLGTTPLPAVEATARAAQKTPGRR